MNDNELLCENRSLGFVGDASGAPKWVQVRVIEVRRALIEKRAVPPMSPSYIAGAEQRSAVAAAAMRTTARLFPTKHTHNEDAALRSIAHRQAAELHNDLKVLSRARLASEENRAAALLAEQVAEENARIFPWSRHD